MKICYRCGNENNDKELFCKTCGCAFPLEEKNGEVVITPQIQSGAADEIKRALRSPLFFFAVAAITLQLILQLFNALFGMDEIIEEVVYNAMSKNGLSGYNYYDIQNILNVAVKSMYMFCLILPAATCAGLWMLWSYAGGRGKTGGLTVVKVVAVVRMVLICIIIAFVILCWTIITALPEFYLQGLGTTVYAQVAVNLVMAFFTACLVVVLIYYIKLIGLLKSMKKALESDMPLKNISVFIIVINFILAFFSLISMFSGGVITFFTELLSIAFYVLLSLCMINFRQSQLK